MPVHSSTGPLSIWVINSTWKMERSHSIDASSDDMPNSRILAYQTYGPDPIWIWDSVNSRKLTLRKVLLFSNRAVQKVHPLIVAVVAKT